MSWDDIEKIFHHTFYNELRVAPEEHPVILPIPANSPASVKEKYTQIFFETFSVPAFSMISTSTLGLLTDGKMSGIAVEFGESSIRVVPTYVCCPVHYAIKELPIGGIQCTEALNQALTNKGYSFTTTAEREIVKDIKEKKGYIALDYDNELKTYSSLHDEKYELPDGQVIDIGSERFSCGEILFQPSLYERGSNLPGVPELIDSAINECHRETRKYFREHIHVFGGCSMFKGLPERLEKDMRKLTGLSGLKITAIAERKYSTWIGGSIVGSLSTFGESIIASKEEYDETGPKISRKFVM